MIFTDVIMVKVQIMQIIFILLQTLFTHLQDHNKGNSKELSS